MCKRIQLNSSHVQLSISISHNFRLVLPWSGGISGLGLAGISLHIPSPQEIDLYVLHLFSIQVIGDSFYHFSYLIHKYKPTQTYIHRHIHTSTYIDNTYTNTYTQIRTHKFIYITTAYA